MWKISKLLTRRESDDDILLWGRKQETLWHLAQYITGQWTLAFCIFFCFCAENCLPEKKMKHFSWSLLLIFCFTEVKSQSGDGEGSCQRVMHIFPAKLRDLRSTFQKVKDYFVSILMQEWLKFLDARNPCIECNKLN